MTQNVPSPCPNCGGSIDPETGRCAECGLAPPHLDPQQYPSSEEEQEQPPPPEQETRQPAEPQEQSQRRWQLPTITIPTGWIFYIGPIPIWIRFSSIIALLFVLLVEWQWPTLIPFDLFHFWFLQGTFGSILADAWPIFVIGSLPIILISVALFIGIWSRRPEAAQQAPSPARSMWSGVWNSIAGEITHRWLGFYCLIVLFKAINILLAGLPQTIYQHVAAPLGDAVTLGKLHDILFNPTWGWAVGAAILSARIQYGEPMPLSLSTRDWTGIIGYVLLAFTLVGALFDWLLGGFQPGEALGASALMIALTVGGLWLAFRNRREGTSFQISLRGCGASCMGCVLSVISLAKIWYWPVGLLLTLVMLKYGIVAAIMVRGLYEALIAFIVYLPIRLARNRDR